MKFIIITIFAIIIYLFIRRLTIRCPQSPPNNNKEHYQTDLFKHQKDGGENYYWDQLRIGKRGIDCYKLNQRDCQKYSNCGLCLKDGKQQCIPGDVHGPFFKEDCEGWIHTNYYDRHIFGEKVTTISPPWNKFYPDYEARWPSPTSRATL